MGVCTRVCDSEQLLTICWAFVFGDGLGRLLFIIVPGSRACQQADSVTSGKWTKRTVYWCGEE
jgi:hypothetical protein